jgi:hypothetical protein
MNKKTLEKALELAADTLNGQCLSCPIMPDICPNAIYQKRMIKRGPCYKAISAHFIAQAEKEVG